MFGGKHQRLGFGNVTFECYLLEVLRRLLGMSLEFRGEVQLGEITLEEFRSGGGIKYP